MRLNPLHIFATCIILNANAHAAITIYTTEAAFLSAVGNSGTDGFDGFNITEPTNSPILRNADPFSYTATVSDGDTFYGAGTIADPWLSANTATSVITFVNFSAGVVAFGGNFFTTDVNGSFSPGNVTLIATDADGMVTESVINSIISSFRGFVSTGSIVSVSLSADQGSGTRWPTAENVILATAIPEPSSAIMAATAALATVGLRRRRQGI